MCHGKPRRFNSCPCEHRNQTKVTQHFSVAPVSDGQLRGQRCTARLNVNVPTWMSLPSPCPVPAQSLPSPCLGLKQSHSEGLETLVAPEVGGAGTCSGLRQDVDGAFGLSSATKGEKAILVLHVCACLQC